MQCQLLMQRRLIHAAECCYAFDDLQLLEIIFSKIEYEVCNNERVGEGKVLLPVFDVAFEAIVPTEIKLSAAEIVLPGSIEIGNFRLGAAAFEARLTALAVFGAKARDLGLVAAAVGIDELASLDELVVGQRTEDAKVPL